MASYIWFLMRVFDNEFTIAGEVGYYTFVGGMLSRPVAVFACAPRRLALQIAA